MEQGLTRSSIINLLNQSVHGKLQEYNKVISEASQVDPEFVAHLIAWDFTNGQIKDSKLALPVITLASRQYPDELTENSLAHLAMQPPRELLKAFKFAIESNLSSSRQNRLKEVVRRYLCQKEKEPGKWSRLAIRHRRSLKSLYALSHYRPAPWANEILFNSRYVPDSIFADVASLSKMDPKRASGVISKWHLSPLIISGAMTGAKANLQDSSVVQAAMEQMSGNEIVVRAKELERKGTGRDQALKETFRKKVAKAAAGKKGLAILKPGVAAEEVEDDGLKTMLRELQERQIQIQKESGGGIDGNWLVISDRSSSQQESIKQGVHVAAAIAKFVTGNVWLAFCNNDVVCYDVTGKSSSEIEKLTKFIIAYGPTSYGIGVAFAIQKKLELDGIVIVGDGGENTHPIFAAAYKDYCKLAGKKIPVYLYQTYVGPQHWANGGHPEQFARFMSREGLDFTRYYLDKGKVDYYSIPNLVRSMSADKFGITEKIMACPLVTLDQVLGQDTYKRKGKEKYSVNTVT